MVIGGILIMDDCKGCLTYYVCDFRRMNKTDNCPCKICIVKMTCNEPCEMLSDYYNKEYKVIKNE
jgi:hypothetical protein